jgi:hypothetical protein
MNQPHYHAVIWIDHREARVFHFGATDVGAPPPGSILFTLI